jgi:hypothetical protein
MENQQDSINDPDKYIDGYSDLEVGYANYNAAP